MPLEAATGKGDAFDAHVTTMNTISELEENARLAEENLAAARAEEKAQRPFLLVAKQEEKVRRLAANLAEAKANLATAKAALPKGN